MEAIVLCPSCKSKNQIKGAPAGTVPVCGKCREQLPWVTKATDDTFENEIKASPVPVLVDFWAEWCPPCRALTPTLESLATEMRGQLKVVKVNTDENRGLARAFNVRSIPMMVLFRDGKPLDSFVGAMPKADLKARLRKSLGKAA